MSAAKSFAFRGLRICVFADEPHLAWLEEFLAPSFSVDSGTDADCTVTIVSDDTDYQGMIERGLDSRGDEVNCFILDSAIVRLPLWKSHTDDNVFFDQRFKVFYCIDRNRAWVRILTMQDNLDVRFALMRVVREFAMSSSHSPETIVIHGAAFTAVDDGILIAGPKRAGKTSLLIHCLQRADRRFIANDRVVVDLAGVEPVLHGMPTLVTVRDQTLNFFPQFEQRLLENDCDYRLTIDEVRQKGFYGQRKRSGNAFDITPSQFCAILGIGMQSQIPIRILLFPQVSEMTAGIELRKLSSPDAAERLSASLFGSYSSGAISQVFALPSPDTCTDCVDLPNVCASLTSQVECFDCFLGYNAYQQGISIPNSSIPSAIASSL